MGGIQSWKSTYVYFNYLYLTWERNETKNALCYEIYPTNLMLTYRYATIITVFVKGISKVETFV